MKYPEDQKIMHITFVEQVLSMLYIPAQQPIFLLVQGLHQLEQYQTCADIALNTQYFSAW